MGNETKYVVCNGNVVVDNYEPVVDFDIEDICNKVNLVAKEFVDYLHKTKIERQTGVGYSMGVTDEMITEMMKEYDLSQHKQ